MPIKSKRRALIIIASLVFVLLSAIVAIAETVNYFYDELNRLKRVEYGNGVVVEYSYDEIGNRKTVTKTPDATPPTTTASPLGGTYNTTQNVTLTCTDGSGFGCNKIFYTTDGSTPTQASSVYASPITVSETKTLKYFAIDSAGNSEAVKTQTYTITVANNPVPATTSLSPTTATVGGTGFTLTVNGSNFINGSMVQWNGAYRATTFVSSTQLTALILSADITAAGTASVTVFTPAPGGGTSNAQTFTITAAAGSAITAHEITSAATGGVCNAPANITAGNLLVASFVQNSKSGNSTLPSGWVLDKTQNLSSDAYKLCVAHKIAGGSEPSTYTFTGYGGSSINDLAIVRMDGNDTSSPVDSGAVASSSATSSSALYTFPSVTTAYANELLYYVGEAIGTPSCVWPSGTLELYDPVDGHSVGYEIQSASGASTARTITWSASSSERLGIVVGYKSATPVTTRTVTVKPSGGDYTSLNAALAAEASNLVALNRILYIECYAMQDTTSVNLTGYTTDANHYIRIYTPASERHQGKWDTNKYRLVTNGQAMHIVANYVRIEGLQIQVTASSGDNANGIDTWDVAGAGDIRISDCIIKGVLSGTVTYTDGVSNGPDTATIVRIFNNLFLDWNRSGARTFIGGVYTSIGTAYYFNNTFVNCYQAMYQDGGTVVAKNNLMYSCNQPAGGTFAAGTDYNATNNASMGYTVTGGGNTHDRISQTFSFVNTAGGDYHLGSSDTGAKDRGVSDPGAGLFSDDIDGQVRQSPWDIGADEVFIATTDVSDNFNRANVNPAGGNWTTITGEGAIQIYNNQARGAGASYNAAYWNANTFNNNQCSRFTLKSVGSWAGPTVRMASSADSYYNFANNTNVSYQYWKAVAGIYTQIGADINVTPQVNDVLTLCVSGTTLTAYINGNVQATRTDSSLASGSAGVYVYGNTYAFDDWAGWDGGYK